MQDHTACAARTKSRPERQHNMNVTRGKGTYAVEVVARGLAIEVTGAVCRVQQSVMQKGSQNASLLALLRTHGDNFILLFVHLRSIE